MDQKGELAKVKATMDDLMVEVSRLEIRSNSFAEVEEGFGELSEEARGLGQDQESISRSFESISKRLVETDEKVRELDDGLQTAALVKQELEDLAGPNGGLARVREQVEEVRKQSLDYGQEVARVREDQADVRAAQEGILSRYEELCAKLEPVDEGVDSRRSSRTPGRRSKT